MDEGAIPEGSQQPEPEEHHADAPRSSADATRSSLNAAAVQPFSDVLASINALLDIPAYTRSNAETRAVITKLFEIKGALEMAALHVVAELDRRADGIPGVRPDFVARTFLRRKHHRTSGQAKLEVECARRLGPDADPLAGGLPMVGQALARGEISREHAQVAVRAVMNLSKEKLARPQPRSLFEELPGQEDGEMIPTGYAFDAVLAARAKPFTSGDLEVIARRIVTALDDDDRDGFNPDDVDRRFVTHAQDPSTGMIIGKFQLDGARTVPGSRPRWKPSPGGTRSATNPLRTATVKTC